MKRTITTVAIALLVAAAVCDAGDDYWTNVIQRTRAAGLLDPTFGRTFVPFGLHPYASLQQWIELQAATAGLETRFDDAAREAAQQHVLLIATGGLEYLPKKYFLGWMFHLFGIVGRVEDDTLVVTRTGEMGSPFKSYLEEDGKWREVVDAGLHAQVSISGTNWDTGQTLSYLAYKTKTPILLDRALMANDHNFFPPPLDRPIDVGFTNAPFGEVLTAILSQRGLTNLIQGGVIFIQKQTKQEAHPQPHRIRSPLRGLLNGDLLCSRDACAPRERGRADFAIRLSLRASASRTTCWAGPLAGLPRVSSLQSIMWPVSPAPFALGI